MDDSRWMLSSATNLKGARNTMGMSYEEFEARIIAVAKARRIFTPHITKNISIAFEMYKTIVAEDRLATVTTTINKPFAGLPLPTCEECGQPMKIKAVPREIDGKIYPTTWVCECGVEEYSEFTAQEWLIRLRYESREQNRSR